jgi:signal transduction histidine kinase
MEWGPGEVSGLIPYSRMKAPPGDLVAQTPAEVFILHRNLFPEMARECHEVTTRLVHVMVDRARNFTSADLHDEKLAALGRLAAGLAHELNNPASAVVSGARSLVGCFAQAEAASAELALSRLEAGQLATVRRIAAVCAGDVAARRSPIEQAEFEDLIADWLDAHGASDEVAQALAQTAVTEELLDQLGDAVEGESLEVALRWIAAMTQGRSLAIEVEQAASSISDLVRAVQGFTAMDRALVAEPIGIGNGLSTSVRVLGAKARQGSTRVRLEIPDDLPRVEAFVGELNQVWLNLISNAIDAAGEGGSVVVAASAEDGWVTVRVVDDGPGISAQDRPFIFEPFFTTKKVGEGTGLGLDIVRRLVLRNEGEIEVDSKPGRTEFRVRLPALPG